MLVHNDGENQKVAFIQRFFLLICIVSIALTISGCTKSESNSSNSGSSGGNSGSSGGDDSGLRTDCGVIFGGELVNPVSTSNAMRIRIQEIVSESTLIVDPTSVLEGPILIRLQGIAEGDESQRAFARRRIEQFGSGQLYFVPSAERCTAQGTGGGSAAVGQVIDASGDSLTEYLVRTGLVEIQGSDACGGGLLSSCLAALKESEPETAGELTSLLWKPESDSDGNLAVHSGPFGASVVVNGETGRNQGPGNGYGSLARFSKSGCAYSSPRIQVLNQSGIPYTLGGNTTFTVQNPCGRHCAANGEMRPCSK